MQRMYPAVIMDKGVIFMQEKYHLYNKLAEIPGIAWDKNNILKHKNLFYKSFGRFSIPACIFLGGILTLWKLHF